MPSLLVEAHILSQLCEIKKWTDLPKEERNMIMKLKLDGKLNSDQESKILDLIFFDAKECTSSDLCESEKSYRRGFDHGVESALNCVHYSLKNLKNETKEWRNNQSAELGAPGTIFEGRKLR